MIEDKRIEEKKGRLLAILEKGVAQVHIDARRAGVLMPEKYRNDMQVALNLSYNYQPPDLTVNTWGIRETLSFSGNQYKVALPWSCIFAIGSATGGELFMYPDEMPAELAQGTVDRGAGRRAAKTAEAPPPLPELVKPVSAKVARSPLRAVAASAAPASAPRGKSGSTAKSAPTAVPAPAPEPKGEKGEASISRSHLRVVK